MGEPQVPGIADRREALQLAERILEIIRCDEVLDVHLTERDLWLLAATVAYARDAFSRMSPIYLAALPFVRDDGTQDATRWPALKTAVLAVKDELAKEKE